eukprot:403368772
MRHHNSQRNQRGYNTHNNRQASTISKQMRQANVHQEHRRIEVFNQIEKFIHKQLNLNAQANQQQNGNSQETFQNNQYTDSTEENKTDRNFVKDSLNQTKNTEKRDVDKSQNPQFALMDLGSNDASFIRYVMQSRLINNFYGIEVMRWAFYRARNNVAMSAYDQAEALKFLKIPQDQRSMMDQFQLENLISTEVKLFQKDITEPVFLPPPFQANSQTSQLETDFIDNSQSKQDLVLQDIPKCEQKPQQLIITMLEVIEHLPIDLIPITINNIFGVLRPSLFIMTTPNQEFNIMFRGCEGKQQFRCDDHIFEWNEQEFRQECDQWIKLYPHYQYEYIGLGYHNKQNIKTHYQDYYQNHVMTQMAVFTIKPDILSQIPQDPNIVFNNHKEVCEMILQENPSALKVHVDFGQELPKQINLESFDKIVETQEKLTMGVDQDLIENQEIDLEQDYQQYNNGRYFFQDNFREDQEVIENTDIQVEAQDNNTNFQDQQVWSQEYVEQEAWGYQNEEQIQIDTWQNDWQNEFKQDDQNLHQECDLWNYNAQQIDWQYDYDQVISNQQAQTNFQFNDQLELQKKKSKTSQLNKSQSMSNLLANCEQTTTIGFDSQQQYVEDKQLEWHSQEQQQYQQQYKWIYQEHDIHQK